MELDEYMVSILDWSIEMDEELSDEQLDMIDLTIRAVSLQMGWQDRISYEYEE
jgi:hypothetical protein